MAQIVQGIVRGGKVELIDGPELADGVQVQVVIDTQPITASPAPDEGTVHTPLEDPGLIDLLARIRRGRPPLPRSPTGPGRKSGAGMLADDPTWDEHLQEVLELRKTDTYGGPRE